MAYKIVLVSDDSDFFEYIRTMLELRKSDELFLFDFDEVVEKLHLIETAVIIINSESSEDKTLALLKLLKGTPCIVCAYNDDERFKKQCYRVGMFDFMPILTPDSEFRARMIPALTISALLEKNHQYRKILTEKKVLDTNNEVFLDYNLILENELEQIYSSMKKAVFLAVSPTEKTKFLLQTNLIETILLNNIRKNDILMTYAPNKYFILLFDIDLKSAQKLWDKITKEFPEKIYAGIVSVSNQKKEQLINEVLNKLHFAINADRNILDTTNAPVQSLNSVQEEDNKFTNFKMFKTNFEKKMEQIIAPVFYQIQQKYVGQFSGIMLEQVVEGSNGTFYIIGKNTKSTFNISCAGFSKVNIDITYFKTRENIDAKRITLEPEEFESGVLEDLLEQFILEYKKENSNGN